MRVHTALLLVHATLLALALACGGGAPASRSPGQVVPVASTSEAGGPSALVAASPKDAWSDADSPIPVSSQDPCLGERDAPVTIVEFGDFQASGSAKLFITLAGLRAAYGPKIRIVWKDM